MQKSSTNLRNRVNKLHLPKTKPLLPLFEVISNSIHAIDEKRKQTNPNIKGKIVIRAIRYGNENALKEVSNIEKYPIISFDIVDNGIGLNKDNFSSFQEFDSEYKLKIGGKGVGRLVCLKAFDKIIVESIFLKDENFFYRNFEYKKSKEGFDNYDSQPTTRKSTGSKITLSNINQDFQKHLPNEILEIARQIITHFQLYFIQKIEPEIIIKNQDDAEYNLTTLYNKEFENTILDDSFEVGDQIFQIYISKSFNAKSHKIHYCAHERTVKDEGLSKYLNDFRNLIKDNEESDGYYFQVFILGDFLNNNVNEERTNFNFSIEEDEEEDVTDISLSKIRREALKSIEDKLDGFLKKVRNEKMEAYLPIIRNEFPNYNSVVNYNREKVEKLPSGLTKSELDIKMYEIESEWKLKVKEEGLDILDKKKDITNLEEYKNLYEKYLTEFNEVGQSDLARYIVHRRSVIDLLDKLIELTEEDKFADEDIVHSLFFPIRETGNTVASDKQNLWLLDERLTFNSLLASDKLFKQVEELGSPSSKRMDIMIKKEEVFENATLYSEDKFPFESFTIVEFKKPERDNYKHGDEKKDPIKQVRTYIQETIDGNTKLKGDRKSVV